MKSSTSIQRLGRRSFVTSMAGCVLLLMQYADGRAEINAQPPTEEFKVTTVFLIRHAEKADAPPEDPPLNEQGNGRSQELARMLAGSGVKIIYTSQFLRAKQTAEPLAKQLGIAAVVIPIRMSPANPREVSEQSIVEITNKIYEQAGGGVLVIGHSNTVPEVIKMLGGDVIPTIDEKKFDDLFVVTLYARGKAKVVQLKYGR